MFLSSLQSRDVVTSYAGPDFKTENRNMGSRALKVNSSQDLAKSQHYFFSSFFIFTEV